MSRLSRKDIKRDEVMETVGSVVDYLRDHARTIGYLILAVIVAVVAGVAFRAYLAARSASSNELLAEALEVYGAPVDELAPQPDDPEDPVFASDAERLERSRELFERVRTEYGGSRAAGMAGVYLGDMAAREGRLDEARELWESFVAEAGDNMLVSQVRVNLMELDRRQGRGDALVDELRAQLESPDPDLPKEMVLHQLGLTLESLGRASEARDTYERLVDDHPASVYRSAARRRLDVLGG